MTFHALGMPCHWRRLSAPHAAQHLWPPTNKILYVEGNLLFQPCWEQLVLFLSEQLATCYVVENVIVFQSACVPRDKASASSSLQVTAKRPSQTFCEESRQS